MYHRHQAKVTSKAIATAKKDNNNAMYHRHQAKVISKAIATAKKDNNNAICTIVIRLRSLARR